MLVTGSFRQCIICAVFARMNITKYSLVADDSVSIGVDNLIFAASTFSCLPKRFVIAVCNCF